MSVTHALHYRLPELHPEIYDGHVVAKRQV